MRFRIGVAALLVGCALTIHAEPQEPNTSVRTVATLSGRVDRVDTSSHSLILRTGDRQFQSVFVGPDVKIFDELKPGDEVTIRVLESVVVATRRNTKPTAITDTTAVAKKESQTSDVMQQLKAVVTVESVDQPKQTIIYKTGDNRRVIRAVADPKLLEGLKSGDIIEMTYTRERAIEIERTR